ncbi:MAG TPA: XRE family transcriptional regulator [Candidatus Omnitrophica bacterium]|nr:XRE family transcriptional regulator [Candidatus Omnitrophota bacterium]
MKNPLKKYRERQRLRQLDLALLLGISEMSVSHWERGARTPSEEMLTKLSEILKVDLETLDRELTSFYERKREELTNKLGL